MQLFDEWLAHCRLGLSVNQLWDDLGSTSQTHTHKLLFNLILDSKVRDRAAFRYRLKLRFGQDMGM